MLRYSGSIARTIDDIYTLFHAIWQQWPEGSEQW